MKRKEGTGSGFSNKRGSVTSRICLAGAKKFLSDEEGEAFLLVRQNQQRGLKSNVAKFKIVSTRKRTVRVKHN